MNRSPITGFRNLHLEGKNLFLSAIISSYKNHLKKLMFKSKMRISPSLCMIVVAVAVVVSGNGVVGVVALQISEDSGSAIAT